MKNETCHILTPNELRNADLLTVPKKCLNGQTLVQLLALYTNPESHNAQRHRHTDRRL